MTRLGKCISTATSKKSALSATEILLREWNERMDVCGLRMDVLSIVRGRKISCGGTVDIIVVPFYVSEEQGTTPTDTTPILMRSTELLHASKALGACT